MKITSIECLELVRKFPPISRDDIPARLSPHPIHRYPDIVDRPNKNPGEALFAREMYVRVTAEDGTSGLGHCHWGEFAYAVVKYQLEPLLVGRDCMAIEHLNDLMWRSFQRMGHGGPTASAQGAIDTALWDLKGQLLGVPVYVLLGGPCRDELDCYATTRNLEWAMELGFTRFKIPNFIQTTDGIEGINRLEEYIAAARETVGPDAELALNTVMAFSVEYAIRVAERLRPYRLAWIEEPLMPWDHDGYAALKSAVPTQPIATGETHRGRHAMRELIDRRAVDIVQPDVRWTGGICETQKIYALAEAKGLQTILHSGGGRPEGQHVSLALPDITQTEFLIRARAGVPLAEANRQPGLATPVNGKIKVSDAPGLGREFLPEDFVSFVI
jgi:L-rhamnonate dehydratase